MPCSQEVPCKRLWGVDVVIFLYIREKIKPRQQICDFMGITAKNETRVCF